MNRSKNILSVVLILMGLLQAPFLYYYTFGFFSFLAIIPYSIIALTLTIMLIVLISKKKHQHFQFHVVAICFSIIFGIFSLSLRDEMEQLDWSLRKSARNEIIHKIKSGKILSYKYYVKEYRIPPISNGGNEIFITRDNGKLTVTFYIDRGFLDHFSAFVYSEDKESLESMALGNIEGIRHLEGNWYRVSN